MTTALRPAPPPTAPPPPAAGRRIAIFLANFHGGGAQRAMLLFAREARARGVAVEIVVARGAGPLRALVPATATVIDLGRGGVLPALPALARHLRRSRPDALYSTMAYCNVVALLAGRLAGRALPVIVREAVVPLSADRARSASGRVLRRLIQLVYPGAYAVIAVSTDVALELGHISRRIVPRLSVLPSPVVSDDVLADGEQALDHPWFGAQPRPVVLGVGRLDPQKDFPTLLRAFAAVRRGRRLGLIVLGEGPDRPALEALGRELGIGPDVQLPGFVANPFPYLRRAAVFVLSSRYEGMATALVQAMAFGTPVVSTDCPGGSREVLADGRFGALVAPGDAGALAAAITAALASPRRPDAAAHVRRRFGAREATDRYLELLPRA